MQNVTMEYSEERGTWNVFVDGEWYYETKDYFRQKKYLKVFFGRISRKVIGHIMNEKEYLEFLADAVEKFSNEIIDKTDPYTLSGQAVINTLKGFRRYVINLIEKRVEQL